MEDQSVGVFKTTVRQYEQICPRRSGLSPEGELRMELSSQSEEDREGEQM
jgi:hypothetical protein